MGATKILLDSGTSYSKIYRFDTGSYEIIPSKEIKNVVNSFDVVAATGHNAGRFTKNVTNELLALAKGAQKYLSGDEKATVIDCGSRDIKYIRIDNDRKISIDWNTECGAFCGQIVELLENYFQFDLATIQPADKPLTLTCGILGMTRMFDLISEDTDPGYAFARFIKGLAENVYQFAGKPDKIYLSGGLCENPLFTKSFTQSLLIPLGRFVLLDGLKADFREEKIHPPH